jgi:nitrogen-specific signal transduction histidine kinase
LLVGAGRRLVWANRRADRLFRVSGRELAGRRFEELVDLDPLSIDRLCRSVAAQGHCWGTFDVLGPRGRRRATSFQGVALGRGLQLFILGDPATAPERGEDELAETPWRSSYGPRQLAALVHEIRTPLAGMLMYLRLIEKEIGGRLSQSLREIMTLARDEVLRVDQRLANLGPRPRARRPAPRPSPTSQPRLGQA